VVADDPALGYRARVVFAPNGPLGHEPAVRDGILGVIGAWDECLVWITTWGVWSSSEDWPRYYTLRGRLGVRLSIDDAPGHRLLPVETDQNADLLLQILNNGWDADIFPARDGRVLPLRVHLSHDGWVMVHAASPVNFAVAGLETEIRS
jgi:hypothetical protein